MGNGEKYDAFIIKIVRGYLSRFFIICALISDYGPVKKKFDPFSRIDLLDIRDEGLEMDSRGNISMVSDKRSIGEVLEQNRNFTPTRQCWTPSKRSGNDIDDLAAVIMGQKPAAIVECDADKRTDALIEMAKEKGLDVRKSEGMALLDDRGEPVSENGLIYDYVVGRPDSVEKVMKAHMLAHSPRRDLELGNALGYHSLAIHDYIADNLRKGSYGHLVKR